MTYELEGMDVNGHRIYSLKIFKNVGECIKQLEVWEHNYDVGAAWANVYDDVGTKIGTIEFGKIWVVKK